MITKGKRKLHDTKWDKMTIKKFIKKPRLDNLLHNIPYCLTTSSHIHNNNNNLNTICQENIYNDPLAMFLPELYSYRDNAEYQALDDDHKKKYTILRAMYSHNIYNDNDIMRLLYSKTIKWQGYTPFLIFSV